MGLIKTIAVLGGTGLAINELTKTAKANRSANVAVKNTVDSKAVKEAIAKDPNLLALVRGETGPVGPQGIQGPQGLSGNSLQNYGGSLLINGNFEQGVDENWSHSLELFLELGYVKRNGETYLSNNTIFNINTERIYKISYEYKSGSSVIPFVSCLNYQSVSAVPTPGNTISYTQTLTNKADFFKVESYLCGVGIGSNNFRANTRKGKFVFYIPEGSELYFKNLILKEISLGEAVPHNLSYLPTGQTVVDNTTGKVGRYNGTTIDWYM